jgi:hypothetical protein
MNENDDSAASRGRTDLLAALFTGIRRACARIRQRHFAQWSGVIRAAAHQLALSVAVAGAGQAHAQALQTDGWARISPNAGYGFGFYMGMARPRGQDGTAPGKYDLLYSDQAQIMDAQTSRREIGNRRTAAPITDPKFEPVLRSLGNAGVMTVALGLNEAVPMMVFTGSVSNRCVGRYPDCSGHRPGFEPVSPLETP